MYLIFYSVKWNRVLHLYRQKKTNNFGKIKSIECMKVLLNFMTKFGGIRGLMDRVGLVTWKLRVQVSIEWTKKKYISQNIFFQVCHTSLEQLESEKMTSTNFFL